MTKLYWGWQLVQTGWGKVGNIAKITGFFASLNIPFPPTNAHFIAGLGFFGGILLILGLGSRLIGLLMADNMLVAYWTADREALTAMPAFAPALSMHDLEGLPQRCNIVVKVSPLFFGSSQCPSG